MENGSLISTFLPQIMKNWDLKSQKFPNFRKGEKKGGGVSKFYNFEKKIKKTRGWILQQVEKCVCVWVVVVVVVVVVGVISRSLPTNFTYWWEFGSFSNILAENAALMSVK